MGPLGPEAKAHIEEGLGVAFQMYPWLDHSAPFEPRRLFARPAVAS